MITVQYKYSDPAEASSSIFYKDITHHAIHVTWEGELNIINIWKGSDYGIKLIIIDVDYKQH